MKKYKTVFLFITFHSHLFSFNFLINIFYSILPQPVRSAFKGEGLQIDQFEYGFGNCNFTSIGYLYSEIEYNMGQNINEKFKFSVPSFYLYGGYIAHVSTPMLTFIYPGWQLETEVGYGGISYHPQYKDTYRELFVTGTSGFNWRVYKSEKKHVPNFTVNLLTGYKLHYVLKDLLYYGTQIGVLLSRRFSISCEYYTTYRGGNFFVFSRELTKTLSKETNLNLSINFLLSKKYLLKLTTIYKSWYLHQFSLPETKQKNIFYGIVLSLISK